MTAITQHQPPTRSRRTQPCNVKSCVDNEVRCRIDTCSYRFVFNKITWHYEEGRLILRGRVPSFYLKQVLQEMLKTIERVDCIENHVDVVSSNGLSSDPHLGPGFMRVTTALLRDNERVVEVLSDLLA